MTGAGRAEDEATSQPLFALRLAGLLGARSRPPPGRKTAPSLQERSSRKGKRHFSGNREVFFNEERILVCIENGNGLG